MSFELFQNGPEYYIPVILTSFIVTLIKYSVFPLIFAGLRKRPISKKKYLLLCYGINLAIMFLFLAITESSSMTPCILWTWAFSSSGIKILRRKEVLDGSEPRGTSYYDPVVEKAKYVLPTQDGVFHMSLSAKNESAEPKPITSDSLAYMGLSAEDESHHMYGIDEAQVHSKNNTPKNYEERINTDLKQPATQSNDTVNQLSISAAKLKSKYCSHCGSIIDTATKKCTGCGKQYFKGITKKFVFACLCGLFFVGLIAGSVALYTVQQEKITELENRNEYLRELNRNCINQISSLENDLSNLGIELSDLEDDLTYLRGKLDFFDKYVVLVEDDGTNWYHNYDCSRFVGNRYWAYNIELAIYNGFEACPHCH